MKKRGIKNLVFLLIGIMALSLTIVACDGSSSGSGGTNVATMTIGTDSEVMFGLDKGLLSFYTTAGDSPVPANSIGVLAVDGTDPEFFFSFAGTTAGTYTIEGGTATFSCTNASGIEHAAVQGLTHTSGTVTIESIGAVGEPIIGGYTVVADIYAGIDTPSYTNTVTITGNFNIARGADRP